MRDGFPTATYGDGPPPVRLRGRPPPRRGRGDKLWPARTPPPNQAFGRSSAQPWVCQKQAKAWTPTLNPIHNNSLLIEETRDFDIAKPQPAICCNP